jgi:two-component system, OmpR family, sensor histidine kinase VicK
MENNQKFAALQEIAELSPNGLIIYSLEHEKVVYSNQMISVITGIRPSEMVGSFDAVLDLVIAEDREHVRNSFSAIREKEFVSDVEFRLRKNSTEYTHICCSAYRIIDGAFLVIYLQDITKPKQHENYLVEFGAKKNTLLDTLAHQISGALNLMRNLTNEAIKSLEGNSNEDVRKYFSLVNENSKYCLEIINDLMRDEHFKSENIFVKTSRVNIVEIIRFIFEELNQSYHHRKFLLQSSAPAIFSMTDEVKLLQIVNNLTSNAIKFSKANTVIQISVDQGENDITVSVKDQGIGIPDKLKPLVFERHSGAGRTGLNGEKSTGVGLSICKNLAQLIDAEIWFESKEGIGSTFFLRLPIR